MYPTILADSPTSDTTQGTLHDKASEIEFENPSPNLEERVKISI